MKILYSLIGICIFFGDGVIIKKCKIFKNICYLNFVRYLFLIYWILKDKNLNRNECFIEIKLFFDIFEDILIVFGYKLVLEVMLFW